MSQTPLPSESRSSIFFMLLGAGIFGFFGFTSTWNYSGVNGQFLLFVALLDWTLKITAIAFGVSAILAMVQPLLGNALYALFGLLSAISLLIVGILDVMDTQHMAMSPLLLFIFAAWNGYGSWCGLKELLARRQSPSSTSGDTSARY